MGPELSIVPVDKVLLRVIEKLLVIYPDEKDAYLLAIEQVRHGDYVGAADTIAQSIIPVGLYWDDIPKLLIKLSKPLACDRCTLLSALYDISDNIPQDDVFKAKADIRFKDHITANGGTMFGTYRSLHNFRAFVASVVKRNRHGAAPLTPEDITQLIKYITEGPSEPSYDRDTCPNLTDHSECDGYYLPYYAKRPINDVFGSLYGLAEELIEFHNTGAGYILFKVADKYSGYCSAVQEQAQLMFRQYVILLQYVIFAIESGGAISID